MPDPDRVAYLTQTTLSLDEARDIIQALKAKFPNIVGPHSQDICYATENRQVAVKNVAHQADLVLVVGSNNSSNSNRLVEVSRNLNTSAYLIENSEQFGRSGWRASNTVAVTAGASAPEILVQEVVNYLQRNGFGKVEEVEVMPENVRFGLPPEIVHAIAAAPASSTAATVAARDDRLRTCGPIFLTVASDEETKAIVQTDMPQWIEDKHSPQFAVPRLVVWTRARPVDERLRARGTFCCHCSMTRATGAASWKPTRCLRPTTSCHIAAGHRR